MASSVSWRPQLDLQGFRDPHPGRSGRFAFNVDRVSVWLSGLSWRWRQPMDQAQTPADVRRPEVSDFVPGPVQPAVAAYKVGSRRLVGRPPLTPVSTAPIVPPGPPANRRDSLSSQLDTRPATSH